MINTIVIPMQIYMIYTIGIYCQENKQIIAFKWTWLFRFIMVSHVFLFLMKTFVIYTTLIGFASISGLSKYLLLFFEILTTNTTYNGILVCLNSYGAKMCKNVIFIFY